jgi:Mn2+/Fe2+ NRAMP family transporter
MAKPANVLLAFEDGPLRARTLSELSEAPLPLDHEIADPANPASEHPGPEKWQWKEFLRMIGPGLMTCLADTDGPCLQTAASSGAQYKYGLVLVQIALMPVLYAAQELTIRLSLVTKDGITGLIRRRFGPAWAWFACTLHVLMCIQQQVGEFGCISQFATDVWGVQKWWPPLLYFLMLFMTMVLGSWYFRMLEFFGMLAGSCQLLMIVVMFTTRPAAGEFFEGLFDMPFSDMNYNILMSGNIGAVIMPWMLYYQQSAIVEKKMEASKIRYCCVDTAVGAGLAQLVMLSTVVAMGTVAYKGPNSPDTGFKDIVDAMAEPLGGELVSKWVISIAMVGACTCASICLMVTPIWSICEIMEWNKSFDNGFRDAPGLYSLQVVGLLIAYLMAVCTEISSQPSWSIISQIVNASLILPVACFLWLLASDEKILPRKYRLAGFYKWLLLCVFSVVCAYCVFGTAMTMVNGV